MCLQWESQDLVLSGSGVHIFTHKLFPPPICSLLRILNHTPWPIPPGDHHIKHRKCHTMGETYGSLAASSNSYKRQSWSVGHRAETPCHKPLPEQGWIPRWMEERALEIGPGNPQGTDAPFPCIIDVRFFLTFSFSQHFFRGKKSMVKTILHSENATC